MKSYGVLAVVLLAFSFSSCDSVISQVASKKHSNQPGSFLVKDQSANIMNGELVYQDKAPFNSVVGLYDLKFNFLCSGTLITSSTVLTAAHCIEGNGQTMVVVFAPNVYETVDFDRNVQSNMNLRPVISAVIHPKYDHAGDLEINVNDIAVVHFKGDLPSGFVPAELDMTPDLNPLSKEETTLLVGYGVSEMKTQPVDVNKVPDLQDRLEMGEIFCYDEENKNCVEVFANGDGPLRATKAPISTVYLGEFVNDETKAGTCLGDSGGPAFRLINNQYYLAGVTSRGSALCDAVGVYSKVSFYVDWIIDNLK